MQPDDARKRAAEPGRVGPADYGTMFDLHGRTVLVVGAGSGIGEASAEGVAAFGAKVACADLNVDAAEATAARIRQNGGTADAHAIDLTDASSVERVLDRLEVVDALVATPAVNVRKPLLDVTPEEFDKVVSLNLKGSFTIMTATARRMNARGKGSIVTFSSIRSQVVEPGQGVYAATKAGTLQMARALAAELGPNGIRVNAIAPGVVETPLTAPIKERPDWYRAYAEKSALQRWSQPRELVGAVVYLCSDASTFVTGSLLVVDGGWLAVDGRFTPPLP